MARPKKSRHSGRSGPLAPEAEVAEPPELDSSALFDTGVWTWVRDRRFPHLASWFNAQVAAGRVLVCELVILELARLTPNERRAGEVAARLEVFPSVAMPAELWRQARAVQLSLAATGEHRSVPPADLLIAAAAELAGVTLFHYDRDYERIADVTGLKQRWFVPQGSLA